MRLPDPTVLVIVGTDTGVGKTFVGRALARVLRDKGRSVVAIKPVESGCSERGEDDQDGVLLARSTGQARPRRALVRLGEPVAPPVAAAREGVELELGAWIEEIRRVGRDADVVLVEGAGGLLSPLTARHTVLDLVRRLDAEVVVVAADRLGTLNHTLLTLEVLRTAGIQPRAVVSCAAEAPDASTGRNAPEVARWGSIAVLEIPRASVDEAAELLRPLADWLVG